MGDLKDLRYTSIILFDMIDFNTWETTCTTLSEFRLKFLYNCSNFRIVLVLYEVSWIRGHILEC